MLGTPRGELLVREPQRAHDAVVQRTVAVVRLRTSRVCEAHERESVAGVGPRVDADQLRGPDAPSRLLERLAHRAVGNRFAGLQMAGRLVQLAPEARFLLDE